MNPRSPRFVYLAVAGIALVVGVGAGFAAHSLTSGKSASPPVTTVTTPSPTTPISSTSSPESLTQIYKQDAPGVVTVTVSGRTNTPNTPFPFSAPQKFEAVGTGFEYDTKGDILTAEHVVAGASTITVTFQNGSTAKATLVGTDSSTDSAVIHIDVPASQLHPLAIGNSAAVVPGQTVVAIGSPLTYAETMTAGIVSAINRTISAPNGFSIPGAIQTDAAINHGNSGGPLIDVATNSVIGVNDQIASGTVNANVGIGFASPIDAVKTSADTLISGGTPQHAWLGVRIGNELSGGVKVGQVISGSPAAKAGLQRGDVITAYNGKSLLNADALTAAVTESHVGDTVTLTIRRGSVTKHLTVTLGNQPTAAK